MTSAGLDKPEPLKATGPGPANVWIVKDLMEAIEKDRQPLGSTYDGRAALEMILAVYESHRVNGPVGLPLENPKHPLTMLRHQAPAASRSRGANEGSPGRRPGG